MSFFGVETEGIFEVQKMLDGMGEEIADTASTDVLEYLKKQLQAQPSPKYVSRQAAYGQTFFSEKQRRWFFANLNEGNLTIPYRRTQAVHNGWEVVPGARGFLYNKEPAAFYLFDDQGQSRQAAMVGWKKLGTILAERADKIAKVLEEAAKKVIRRRGG